MIAGVLAALALACTTAGPVERPESSLNCLTLFPTPDLAASGSIALRPVASPFGIAVTVDGRPRYHLVADIAGLPDPHSLGAYSAYVAWGYTLGLDSAVKLGPVRNGRVDFGELDYVQFRILISAERSSDVRSRTGRLVLRGTSPSARLLAHRDLTTPVSPGVPRDAARSAAVAMAGAVHPMERDAMPSAVSWRMAPMPPRMAMMPGMSGLSPNTAPYLPASAATRDASRTIRLRDRDTVNLTPRPFATTMQGKPVTMLGYNGMLPGPRLEVPQDAQITARVMSALDGATSIHWHGIRLDNAFDGAVGLTQAAIEPGGSFDYSVRFPDAGFYWYHPHAREDLQQGLGLYGTIVVRSANPNYYNVVNREEMLVLSDILMDERGLIPFGGDVATHALMGRVGNVLLVNGETRYSLAVDRGSVVRFFIANAANARFYNLSFSDPRVRMKVVASDAGKFEREALVESVVIGPSERYVIEARFPGSGRVALVNRVQALDHMIGSYSRETDTLGVVNVSGKAAAPSYARSFADLRSNRDVVSALAPFRYAFDRPVDHELVLTMQTNAPPAAVANMLLGINAAMEWNDGMPMMNMVSTSDQIRWVMRDPATGKENMDIDWRFRRGDVVKLRITNDPSSLHAMQHPIHLHGQRFLVLTRDGVPSENLVWKDTAIIPAGETVELLADMSNPGRWMIHCHIAEHLTAGMMAAFTVE
jgi:FtsP/CotA-like multicopper oxidase with cupredoxin domain